jgi:mRNA interferase RelE/StbE
MNSKRIQIEKKARKFIDKQPLEQKKRLLKAIKGLPDNGDIKKMRGFESLYRLRVGDYRVLYSIDNNGEYIIIVVSDADNRGQVYK